MFPAGGRSCGYFCVGGIGLHGTSNFFFFFFFPFITGKRQLFIWTIQASLALIINEIEIELI